MPRDGLMTAEALTGGVAVTDLQGLVHDMFQNKCGGLRADRLRQGCGGMGRRARHPVARLDERGLSGLCDKG
jgi:hypothetical protein